MTILLVGFDSAWTPTNSGALVGVLQLDDGMFNELGPPQIVDYREAERVILKWQAEHVPTSRRHTCVRDLPSAGNDCARLDASGFTPCGSPAQVQP